MLLFLGSKINWLISDKVEKRFTEIKQNHKVSLLIARKPIKDACSYFTTEIKTMGAF